MDTITKLVYGGLITSGLFALTIWFLTRYIKQRDEFEKETNDKISKIPDKIKTSVESVQKSAEDFKNQVNDLKSHNLDYQRKVQSELNDISKQAGRIETTLEKSSVKATEIDHKLTQVQERVQFHDSNLRDILEANTKLHKQIKETDESVRSVKVWISENYVLIKDKKQDPSNKG